MQSGARDVVILAAVLALGPTAGWTRDIGASPEFANKVEKNYSPYVGWNFPQRVFWGDTHLHTSYSTDAGMAGNTVGPEDAYRFAEGEMVISSTGQKAQLKRPLDFLVIADHAENPGLAPFINKSDPGRAAASAGQEVARYGERSAFPHVY
jgi:hypothetical protein